MRKQDQDDQVRQAKNALRRVEQESEKILGAQPTQADADDEDQIDIWGKRIGRGIGYVIVIILIWHLTTTYFIK